MKELTDEQRAAYIASGGHACPFCGSDDLIGDEIEIDDAREVCQHVDCHYCDASWTDVYALSTIVDEEKDDD